MIEINSLTPEILFNIFSFLPQKDRTNVPTVSKYWNSSYIQGVYSELQIPLKKVQEFFNSIISEYQNQKPIEKLEWKEITKLSEFHEEYVNKLHCLAEKISSHPISNLIYYWGTSFKGARIGRSDFEAEFLEILPHSKFADAESLAFLVEMYRKKSVINQENETLYDNFLSKRFNNCIYYHQYDLAFLITKQMKDDQSQNHKKIVAMKLFEESEKKDIEKGLKIAAFLEDHNKTGMAEYLAARLPTRILETNESLEESLKLLKTCKDEKAIPCASRIIEALFEKKNYEWTEKFIDQFPSASVSRVNRNKLAEEICERGEWIKAIKIGHFDDQYPTENFVRAFVKSLKTLENIQEVLSQIPLNSYVFISLRVDFPHHPITKMIELMKNPPILN